MDDREEDMHLSSKDISPDEVAILRLGRNSLDLYLT